MSLNPSLEPPGGAQLDCPIQPCQPATMSQGRPRKTLMDQGCTMTLVLDHAMTCWKLCTLAQDPCMAGRRSAITGVTVFRCLTPPQRHAPRPWAQKAILTGLEERRWRRRRRRDGHTETRHSPMSPLTGRGCQPCVHHQYRARQGARLS